MVDFLWQGPELQGAASFSEHDDCSGVDENPKRYTIQVTVVLKLTSGNSAMQVRAKAADPVPKSRTLSPTPYS